MKKAESRTSFYYKWRSMWRRCNSKVNKDYTRYGARGIKVEWRSYFDFKKDMYSSYIEHYKKHNGDTSIERINNNGNYSKENCIWATSQEQSRNRRTNKYLTINGITRTYADWAKLIGCSRQALRYRVVNGLKKEFILTLPFKHSNKFKNNE